MQVCTVTHEMIVYKGKRCPLCVALTYIKALQYRIEHTLDPTKELLIDDDYDDDNDEEDTLEVTTNG